MALGEIARDLQKTASDELLLLRDMRRYVNLNNDRALQAERQRLADFDEIGRASCRGKSVALQV